MFTEYFSKNYKRLSNWVPLSLRETIYSRCGLLRRIENWDVQSINTVFNTFCMWCKLLRFMAPSRGQKRFVLYKAINFFICKRKTLVNQSTFDEQQPDKRNSLFAHVRSMGSKCVPFDAVISTTHENCLRHIWIWVGNCRCTILLHKNPTKYF